MATDPTEASPVLLPGGVDSKEPGPRMDHKLDDSAPKGWISIQPEEIKSFSIKDELAFIPASRAELFSLPPTKLTYLVVLQPPPIPHSFINIDDSLYMLERSSHGVYRRTLCDSPPFTPDVLAYLGTCGRSLNSIRVPMLTGTQHHYGANVDLRSTSVAHRTSPFPAYTRAKDSRLNYDKIEPFIEVESKPQLTLGVSLLEAGFVTFREVEKKIGLTVKKTFIESITSNYTSEWSKKFPTPMKERDNLFYWCDLDYLDEVTAGLSLYYDLFDHTPYRTQSIMRSMGLTSLNYSTAPIPLKGEFKGEGVYSLPRRLGRPFIHEHPYIYKNSTVRVSRTSVGRGSFSASSIPRVSIIQTRAPGLNTLLQCFTEAPATSPIFQSMRYQWMLEGFMIKPQFIRDIDPYRFVMEIALYLLFIPPFGTGRRFHETACQQVAEKLGVSDDLPYTNISKVQKTAPWNSKRHSACFDLLACFSGYEWERLRVRPFISDRVSYVYIPKIILQSYKDEIGELPFGPTYAERTSSTQKIVNKVTRYYLTFRLALIEYLGKTTRKAEVDAPWTGDFFGVDFVRAEIDFYHQLISGAERNFSSRMPWESEEYIATTVFNLNPFCLLVYPCAEGEKMVSDIECLAQAEYPLPMEPILMTTILDSEHDQNMVEIIHLIGLWSFRQGFIGSPETHAFISLYLFVHILAESSSSNVFVSNESFFQPEQCKRFPLPAFDSIPESLTKYYDYFKFMARWQLDPLGEGIHLSYTNNLWIFDNRFGDPAIFIQSVCANLLRANTIFDWLPPPNRESSFFQLSKPVTGGVLTLNADQLVTLAPRMITDFQPKHALYVAEGLASGMRVGSTQKCLLLSTQTYSAKIVVENSGITEIQKLITCPKPTIIRSILGGYDFSPTEVIYPLVPQRGIKSLPPPYIVKYAQCDDRGNILRPLVRVLFDYTSYTLAIAEDTSSTTLREVFTDGDIVAAPYRVQSFTTVPLLPPDIPTILRSSLLLYKFSK